MKKSQKSSRHIFSCLASLVLMLCCSACNVTNSVRLWVCNMTDSVICLEVNIDSEEYTTYDIAPDENVEISVKKMQKTYMQEISISDFVSNPNASVKIFIKGEKNQRLVKVWRYSEREEIGRSFFNDLFWAKDYKRCFVDPDGSSHDSYVFTITQHDIAQ